jgi:hypothetical protein
MENQMENERIRWYLMGVDIGTASGWDQMDTFSMIIYDFIPNKIGKKFVPDFDPEIYDDLIVDWESGKTSAFDKIDDTKETFFSQNWSVFNKKVENSNAQ